GPSAFADYLGTPSPSGGSIRVSSATSAIALVCRCGPSTVLSGNIRRKGNAASEAVRDAPGMIRDYEPARHRDQLRSCVVELQEFERGLEPALPPGEEMADAYLAFLLERCSRASGRGFVAKVDHTV